MPDIVLNAFHKTSYLIHLAILDDRSYYTHFAEDKTEARSDLPHSTHAVSFTVDVRPQAYLPPQPGIMLSWDAQAGRAFPEVERPSTQGMALSWRRVPSWARRARTGRAAPAARSGRRLGAQLPRFCGTRAGAGERGGADGAGGGGGRLAFVALSFAHMLRTGGRRGRPRGRWGGRLLALDLSSEPQLWPASVGEGVGRDASAQPLGDNHTFHLSFSS